MVPVEQEAVYMQEVRGSWSGHQLLFCKNSGECDEKKYFNANISKSYKNPLLKSANRT